VAAPGSEGRKTSSEIDVAVTRRDGGYRAELSIVAEDGTTRHRTLQTETCSLAADAVVVVVAASASVASSESSEPAEPAATSAPSTSSSAAPSIREAPAPAEASSGERPRSSSWGQGMSLGLRGLVDVGALPVATPGLALDLGLDAGALRGVARAGVLATSEVRATSGSGAELHGFVFGVGLCFRPLRAPAPLELGACAGLSAVLVHARGVDVDRPASADRLVPALDASVTARWPARSTVGLRLDLLGKAALARPDFTVVGDASLHRPSALGAQVLLGPEVRF